MSFRVITQTKDYFQYIIFLSEELKISIEIFNEKI